MVILVSCGLMYGQGYPEEWFSVVGANSVYIKDGCTIESGHVAVMFPTPGPHLSPLAQLVVGDYVYGGDELFFIADTIYIDNGSNIFAALYNGLTNYGTIRAYDDDSLDGPFWIDVLFFPPPTVGTQDIKVLPYTQLVLPPGQYNKITVYNGANLIFEGGTYEIEKLYVPGDYCGLFFRGPSLVNINSRFITDVGMTLGPETDAVSPNDIHIISHYDSPEPLGKEAVRFGPYALVRANVRAYEGTIKVKTGCTIEGRLIGEDVFIWDYVLVRLPL